MESIKAWTEIVSLVLIVIGALNWGLVGAFRFNLVTWIAKRTHKYLEPSVYILVGLSALLHLLSRDYYLSFLGKAALPCGSLVERVPEKADAKVELVVEPNVNVIYWAAEPNKEIQKNPWVAYQDYANAGVARSDASGRVTLRFRSPAQYNVMFRTVKQHVHYRVCKSSGMIGRVQTFEV